MSGIYSLHMEPDAVTLRSSCFLSDRQRGGTVGVCDSVEQEPTVAHKHNSCTGGRGCVPPWWRLGSLSLCLPSSRMLLLRPVTRRSFTHQTLASFKPNEQRRRACLSDCELILRWHSDLQEESRTLGHEDESDECRQSRKQADEYEQPPAVHLKLWADGETPAWVLDETQTANFKSLCLIRFYSFKCTSYRLNMCIKYEIQRYDSKYTLQLLSSIELCF